MTDFLFGLPFFYLPLAVALIFFTIEAGSQRSDYFDNSSSGFSGFAFIFLFISFITFHSQYYPFVTSFYKGVLTTLAYFGAGLVYLVVVETPIQFFAAKDAVYRFKKRLISSNYDLPLSEKNGAGHSPSTSLYLQCQEAEPLSFRISKDYDSVSGRMFGEGVGVGSVVSASQIAEVMMRSEKYTSEKIAVADFLFQHWSGVGAMNDFGFTLNLDKSRLNPVEVAVHSDNLTNSVVWFALFWPASLIGRVFRVPLNIAKKYFPMLLKAVLKKLSSLMFKDFV